MTAASVHVTFRCGEYHASAEHLDSREASRLALESLAAKLAGTWKAG